MRRASVLKPAFGWLHDPGLWRYKAKTEEDVCCAFVADALASVEGVPPDGRATSGAARKGHHMTPGQIIAAAEARGIVFTLGADFALQYDAPAGAMTSELRRLLAEHKPGVVDYIFQREERAGLQDAPEWQDAGMWERGTRHRAALALLATFARRGVGLSFVSVTPSRRAESEAA